MDIGVDARSLVGNVSGVGNYLANVIEAGAFDGHRAVAYYDPTDDGSPVAVDAPDATRLVWRPVAPPARIADAFGAAAPIWWLNVSLARRLRRDAVDLFFGPNFVQPLTFAGPSVIVVHDMVHRRHPDAHPPAYRWYLRAFLGGSLRRADRVVTVSEHTRTDLLHYHDLASATVTTAYGAANDAYRPRDLSPERVERLRREYDLPEEFLLYVGNIEPRKNLTALLSALATFDDADRPPLVIVGQKHLAADAFARAYRECSFADRITFTGYVAEADLPAIYNLATVFAYPSLYEGFGLPVLEALQSGTPVVTSNRSSLPEVADDAALVADPDDAAAFAAAINRLWSDPDERERYHRRGRERAAEFSWARTADRIASVVAAAGAERDADTDADPGPASATAPERG